MVIANLAQEVKMKNYIFEILENECWWGGCVTDSHELPLTVKSDYYQDMRDNKTSNQKTPCPNRSTRSSSMII